jgi:hypothetical protein
MLPNHARTPPRVWWPDDPITSDIFPIRRKATHSHRCMSVRPSLVNLTLARTRAHLMGCENASSVVLGS